MLTRAVWWPPVLWAALILVLTSLPATALPLAAGIPGLDKVAHAALYIVLGVLLAPTAGRAGWLRVLVAVALFAAGDEWHQRWIAGRSAEAGDWIADVAGAAGGLLFQRARSRQENVS
jgi:VanZ family protein